MIGCRGSSETVCWLCLSFLSFMDCQLCLSRSISMLPIWRVRMEVLQDACYHVALGLDVRMPPVLCVSLTLPCTFCWILERLCAQLVSMMGCCWNGRGIHTMRQGLDAFVHLRPPHQHICLLRECLE